MDRNQDIQSVEISDMPDRTLVTEAIAPCICFIRLFAGGSLSERDIGTDTTKGRYGSVDVQNCSRCGRRWLKYAVEYAGFSESSRYFRGVITREIAVSVTPETAAKLLGGLEWHLYGGDYYRGGPFKGSGPVHVDLF